MYMFVFLELIWEDMIFDLEIMKEFGFLMEDFVELFDLLNFLLCEFIFIIVLKKKFGERIWVKIYIYKD